MKLISVECKKKTPDDGQRRCPKHVEFYNRIKLGYLIGLVGYVRRNLFSEVVK